jgi:predicted AlkP superfamily phosphohydrolase/phosphomutase
MKILVIGLDGAAPEILLGDDRLANIRRLMEVGAFGRLESIVPPITVPAWLCMSTSRDPGSLGVYGFRNRADRSYDRQAMVESRSVGDLTIWDQVAREGKRSILVGVPPNYPPRKVNGVSVGCFLTPDPARNVYTHPPELARTIAELVGDYAVDVTGFRSVDKRKMLDDANAMTRKQFAVFRHLLETQEWDYAHFVAIGLDRLQHGFWSHHDPEHVRHPADSPYKTAILDHYRLLDDEIGRVLEMIDDETIVAVLSDHGARRLEGGFCINQWLLEKGFLHLNHRPDRVTPFGKLDVDWEHTLAWSEGGYYARIYLNLQGREPRGAVAKADYHRVRDALKEGLEGTTGPDGRLLGTLVFKPEEVYREVRGVAPDLIAHFGGLAWRSVGGVGYPGLLVQEDETGPDDCNHSQHGAFVLGAPGLEPMGEVEGAHLLDIAPTLLDLGGYDVPPSMQGKSLVSGRAAGLAVGLDTSMNGDDDDDELVRCRLGGLGYLS